MDHRTTQRLRLRSLGLLSVLGLTLTATPQRSDAQTEGGPEDAPVVTDGVDLPDPVAPSTQPMAGAEAVGDGSGPLVGMPGAATALAIRDYAAALRLSEGSDEVGTDAWYARAALRGRAQLRAEQAADAVATLAPLWAEKRKADHFPPEVLGFELAQAKLAWAASGALPVADADAQRREAISILGKVRKLSPIRNLAEVRVLQSEALAQIQGTTARETTLAGRKASTALQRIVRDYPNHPRVGELWLEQGKAMARGGDPKGAAALFRTIFIQRAGEPESDAAWAELEALDAQSTRIRASALSTTEKLERAMAARRLRWVELSREILDEVIDTTTSKSLRTQARSSRAYTAYKQRDFARCADDLRPGYEATGYLETRDRLLRCLERGAMYDEALAIYDEVAKSKRKGTRANAYWNATNLAVRAGLYARAEDYLTKYEKLSAGNRQSRTWLRAWLPMRLGRVEEAIAGFEAVERYSSDRLRARYFRGKLLLGTDDPAKQLQGVDLLNETIEKNPLSYYGLMARQRLLDAERPAPDLPTLEPARGEPVHPTRAEVTATLARVDETFGDAWPTLRRARQLYLAGYLEEARRELRVTVQAYETRGGKSGGPRNESFIVGLGWKPDWSYPRVRPTRDGLKTLRSKESAAQLKEDLRELARGLDEPYRFAKMSSSADGAFKARWHPRAFRAAVEREARLQDVDPIHMWSLMYTESRFRRFVVSPVGARGALQIMPWTAQQLAERLGELEPGGSFNDDGLFDIDTNAHLAGYYVAELLKKFHGQAPMAYASYNGGPSNVQRWVEAKANGEAKVPLERDVFIEEIAFRESYRYAKRVTEVSAAYSLMYRGEFPRWDNLVDAEVEDNIAF